jgi:hypothetical protein
VRVIPECAGVGRRELVGKALAGSDWRLREARHRGHEEQDLVTQDFVFSEVERMIHDGEIKDATTVAALGLLRLKGLL